jgi:hypothetical protein
MTSMDWAGWAHALTDPELTVWEHTPPAWRSPDQDAALRLEHIRRWPTLRDLAARRRL